MNEKRLIEANTKLVDTIRGLKYDIVMLESKINRLVELNKSILNDYDNQVKKDKSFANGMYKVSKMNLQILQEYEK